jgi:hypothetical protein
MIGIVLVAGVLIGGIIGWAVAAWRHATTIAPPLEQHFHWTSVGLQRATNEQINDQWWNEMFQRLAAGALIEIRHERKIPERAKDCVTLADKIGFSLMVREKWQQLSDNPWSCPSDIHAIIDAYDDPDCAWSHPEWASYYSRSQEEKERALRSLKRVEKRQANRRLYGKSGRS